MKQWKFDLKEFNGNRGLGMSVEIAFVGGRINFAYRISGHGLSGVLLPVFKKESDRLRRNGLWEETCFEFFWKGKGSKYWEMNLAPSGDWQIYEFNKYRDLLGEAPLQISNLQAGAQRESYTISGTIEFGPQNQAVIDKVSPTGILKTSADRFYFANSHPKDKPDFHNQDFWVDVT